MLATFLAFLAAVLYAINIPLSKILLKNIEPVFLSAFLYLGAGIGIGMLYWTMGAKNKSRAEKLTKKELPYTIGMIVLDIAAPICLMVGLASATAANVSLVNNFEIVVTSLIALLVFKEWISKKLWIAILLITLASILLSVEDVTSFRFSSGSWFVLAACVCWGFENNCTKMLSDKNTYEIVMLKGIFSGTGSLIIALFLKEAMPGLIYIGYTLLLGFVAYGLSIFFYVRAQKELGAAKTSAYYAAAPFVGTALSCVILHERLNLMYFIALAIMIVGAGLVVLDTLVKNHTHLHTHTVVHTHDNSTHTHVIQHSHPHEHLSSEETHRHHHKNLAHGK